MTLVELLIVLAVMAVLATIVIPNATGAARTARESALREQLQALRSAIQQFGHDCGDYPASLDELITRPAPGVGGSGIELDVASWQGPYFLVRNGDLPTDPITGSNTTWEYTPTTGDIHSGSAQVSASGTAYSSW